MGKLLFILFIFLPASLLAAGRFRHFQSCNQPSLIVGNQEFINHSQYSSHDFTCERNQPLPSLGEMDDFIKEFYEHQNLESNRISLLGNLSNRLRFMTQANIKKLELQKECFQTPKKAGCKEVRMEILNGIEENWNEMSLSLVLGFQRNSAVRYQFGAPAPDLFIHTRTRHPFGGRVRVNDKIRDEAQKIFSKKLEELGPQMNEGLRDYLQDTYSKRYNEALNRAPIMALVDSPTPNPDEIIEAIDEMIENNEKMLEREFDAGDLAGFYPLMEMMVEENPQYCTIAEHLVDEKLRKDQNTRYLQVGTAVALGGACLATGWSGLGMSLCFAAGTVMTGTNFVLSQRNRNLERMRSFTSALDNQLVSDFNALSEAEQDYAMELMMLPLAGLGAGHFLKTVAPSSRLTRFLTRLQNMRLLRGASEFADSTDEISDIGRALQSDMAGVRSLYRTAEDVSICGLNIGSYMCRNNVQEFLRYARAQYPDFDMSKARVIKIEAPEYVPLYANNATRPAGYTATTAGGVDEYASIVRSADDGATTWSRHYVLEYEGRVYDFDHASDVAMPTSRYMESQFQDALTGVVNPETSSRYSVGIFDADEFANADDISRFDIRNPNQETFFDFYRGLDDSNPDLVLPTN